ncbi:alpha/beta hydrolase [Azospirillum sp. 11R-A]
MALFLLLNPEATKGQEVKMRGDIMTADWLHSFPRTDDGRNARQTALGPTSTVGDLLVHPAFTGFAKRILPWDDRPYDASLPLSNVGTMLPYHSHVDAGVVISGLNRMIADVSSGRTIFYDIYSEAEKRAQPAKEHTGLFFFRGPPGAPFALIAPGGGFAYVGSVHEGFPYALDINNRGYNAFVLKYRTGQGGRVATEDLATAVSFVVRNAATLEVGTEDYSLWGSSAGARMAAFIGSHGVAAFNGDNLPKPSAVVMAYTAHADTSSNEPPTFAVVGEQDGIAPPSSMESRIAVLHRSGTPVEFHRYPNVGHGFGTGRGTSADGWIINAVRFWERRMNSNASK